MKLSPMWKGVVVMIGAGVALSLPVGCDKVVKDSAAAVVVVETSYPGASAPVVADTLAAPIEQQVNGVENLLHLASRSTDDGRYVLAATFKPGTDLDEARERVQKRVALAIPLLPEEVKRVGVSVKKRTPVLLLASLSAPTGSHDTLYLSHYANRFLKDELASLAGVGEVRVFGQRDAVLRILLDPEKLAARNLTVNDVIAALREQNVQKAAGQIGQEPEPRGKDLRLTVKALGRQPEPAQVEDVIVKTGADGRIVRLKDVSKVTLEADDAEHIARFNGKPCVVPGIGFPEGAKPKDGSRAVAEKLAKLREDLPEGLRLEVVCDFTADHEYLRLEVRLPDAAAADRVHRLLEECEKLLRDVPGVQDLITLTENPFDLLHNQPGILVRLAPADQRKMSREDILRAARTKLQQIQEASLRLRPLSDCPIDLAISGPEAEQVRKLTEKFGERLRQSQKLTDVWVVEESTPRQQIHLTLDREKCKQMGVQVADVFQTLQIYLGAGRLNDFDRFGRTWRVVVQGDDKGRGRIEDLKQLKVRNGQGAMVPLGSLAALETSEAPTAIHRVALKPAVGVSADLEAGVSPEQARALCEAQLEAARRDLRLPEGYGLIWLR